MLRELYRIKHPIPRAIKLMMESGFPVQKHLSPLTCIFLTAEEDEGLLLIVPRPTPQGPGERALAPSLSLTLSLSLDGPVSLEIPTTPG